MIGVVAILNLCQSPGICRLGNGGEIPKVDALSSIIDNGQVSLSGIAKADADHAGFVVVSRGKVLHVPRAINFAQIAPTIVGAIAVDMVDLIRGFISGHHAPDYAMCHVARSKNIYSDISATTDVGAGFSGVSRVPRFPRRFARLVPTGKQFARSMFPSKDAGCWIIIQQFAQNIGGWYFNHSHIGLRNRLVWSGVRGVFQHLMHTAYSSNKSLILQGQGND